MKELKELSALVLGVTEVIFTIAEKKLGTIGAIIKFLPLIPKIAPAVNGLNLLVEEIKAMDEDQKEELKEWLAAEFDISDDETEATIEMVLGVVVDLSGLLQLEVAKRAAR